MAAVFTDCCRRLAPLPCVYWHAHLPSRQLISGHWQEGFSVDLHRRVILLRILLAFYPGSFLNSSLRLQSCFWVKVVAWNLPLQKIDRCCLVCFWFKLLCVCVWGVCGMRHVGVVVCLWCVWFDMCVGCVVWGVCVGEVYVGGVCNMWYVWYEACVGECGVSVVYVF